MSKVRRRHPAALVLTFLAVLLVHSSAQAALVGFWRMEEASGEPRLDSSGRGNTLTSSGNVEATGVFDGAVRRAAQNFATSRYLYIPEADQSGLNITGSFTLAAWVYRTSTATPQTIASRWGDGAVGPSPGEPVNRRSFRLSVTGGKLRAETSPNGVSLIPLDSTSDITVNTWHHVAMTFESGAKRMRVYVNGVLENSTNVAYSQLFATPPDFTVGASYSGNAAADAWVGTSARLDEVRIYNSALSPSDIAALCARPGTFSLSSPEHGATGLPRRPTLRWESSAGALEYDVIIATNTALTTVIASGTVTTRSFTPPAELNANTLYYWGVMAVSLGGAREHNPSPLGGARGPFSFRTNPMPGSFSLSSPGSNATNIALLPTFTWGASSNAADYLLEYADNEELSSPFSAVIPADQDRSFAVTSKLQYFTDYWWRVTARNNVGSVGNNTPNPRRFTTKVDNDPPVIVKTVPAHEATGVSVSKPLTVRFDEPLLPESVTAVGAVRLLDSESAEVPIQVSLAFDGFGIRIVPEDELQYSATYSIRLAGTIKDLLNNQRGISNPYPAIDFTTWSEIAGFGDGPGCGASGAPVATALLLAAAFLRRRR